MRALLLLEEVLSLLVCAGFSMLWLKEPLAWNHVAGFALLPPSPGPAEVAG